jgi:catechol 2,3-dioxygenase
MQRFGNQVAFISAGGYHHHIGLNTWNSLGRARRPASTARGCTMRPSCTRSEPIWRRAVRQLMAANYPHHRLS